MGWNTFPISADVLRANRPALLRRTTAKQSHRFLGKYSTHPFQMFVSHSYDSSVRYAHEERCEPASALHAWLLPSPVLAGRVQRWIQEQHRQEWSERGVKEERSEARHVGLSRERSEQVL